MDVITSNWKSNIFCQVKEHNRQQHGYQEIFEHYNRILETNASLKVQCNRFENDVKQLRLANAGLEKASEASQALANVNNKLTVANEEVIMHLRDKGELAREVLRLNHELTDLNKRYINEETIAQQYKTENEQLHEQLKRNEFEMKDLLQINQVLREEFQAIKSQLDLLQIDYNRIKPNSLELEQQLESVKRMNQRLENELILHKNKQAEIYNYDSELFNRTTKKFEQQKSIEPSIFLDDDVVVISSTKSGNETYSETLINSNSLGNNSDGIYDSITEPIYRDRRSTMTGTGNGKSNLLSSIMRKITNGMTNSTYDRLNRTSTCCLFASLPTREINRWDCTELEVYSLQFQPSGSILATGCSDKMVHLWEIAASGQQYKYCSLQGSQGAIVAIDFDNEGYRLLAGCSSEKIYLWSYGEYRTLKDTYAGHQGTVYTCKFISGTKLASGSADRTIKIWDLHGRYCTRTLFAGSKCYDLVVTDAAGSIISGHYDKKIRLWDPYTDRCRSELQYDAPIISLAYNNEKQQLLACFKDDTLKLIDLRQNRTICTFSHDNFKISMETTKAILSPDGRYACVGSHDGSVVVWNTETKQCESVLKRKHTTMVTSVAWQPDGNFVASCEKHRRVILWSQ